MNAQPDWMNAQYLQNGNARQRRAYVVLKELAILTTLFPYDPIVVGTIPIDIDLPDSDVDIICHILPENKETFKQLLRASYAHLPAFQLRELLIGGQESLVSSFFYEELQVEVFAQARPTAQQLAYRHMLVEYAVLQAGGEKWRTAVRHLKQLGLKTEPAFATLLQLAGDPYQALLLLEELTEAELTAWITRSSV
ncbi:DUF4269 domain-containing protein [Hymenobacter volaticus]|uniref:DUF4269 domain-containing protein n=1 Tax=Hymenobacter volaticus TaxID=2932254 RepID=A0ABY4GET0_9BACT|nr:DUF4269 domain-containing protein [Hymenobacter volaticus]UOQ69433.1 DUF4269 domain-containing protein [Hymenobacter volaticus]